MHVNSLVHACSEWYKYVHGCMYITTAGTGFVPGFEEKKGNLEQDSPQGGLQRIPQAIQ